MGSISKLGQRRNAAGILALFTLCCANGVEAVTLHELRDPAFARIYGQYAPRGKCDGPLSLKIDAEGMVFRVDGETYQPAKFEHALSFFGPDYSGISLAFFPFPRDDTEPGHVLMFVNADEIEGRIAFEENLGPGERLTYSEARIVAASPWLNCAIK